MSLRGLGVPGGAFWPLTVTGNQQVDPSNSYPVGNPSLLFPPCTARFLPQSKCISRLILLEACPQADKHRASSRLPWRWQQRQPHDEPEAGKTNPVRASLLPRKIICGCYWCSWCPGPRRRSPSIQFSETLAGGNAAGEWVPGLKGDLGGAPRPVLPDTFTPKMTREKTKGCSCDWEVETVKQKEWFSKCGPPVSNSSTGDLLETRILSHSPHPKPPESATRRRSPQMCFNKFPVILRQTEVWEPPFQTVPLAGLITDLSIYWVLGRGSFVAHHRLDTVRLPLSHPDGNSDPRREH